MKYHSRTKLEHAKVGDKVRAYAGKMVFGEGHIYRIGPGYAMVNLHRMTYKIKLTQSGQINLTEHDNLLRYEMICG